MRGILKSSNKNRSKIFSMRIGEKMFIYSWMGHFELSLATYGGIPMAPPPCCLMPTSWAKVDFSKIGHMAAKKRFWPKWSRSSRDLKIGPRGSPGVPLTPIYRGLVVGSFWTNIKFRPFLAILAILRYSPNMALTPPLNRGPSIGISEIDPSHLGTPYSQGAHICSGAPGFYNPSGRIWDGNSQNWIFISGHPHFYHFLKDLSQNWFPTNSLRKW